MNSQNLQPFKAGEARARDAGQKGGVASGVARKERTRALLLAELDREHTYTPAMEDGSFSFDFTEKPAGYSRRVAMVKKLVSMAVGGDLKAVKMVIDLTEGGDEDDDDPTVEA